jgi:predicted transcriptional regulator
MRTTIRLPDDLYQQVRAEALAAGSTTTSFIEEALRAALLRRGRVRPDADRYEVEPFAGTGVLPGVDVSNSAALLELMDR